MMQGFAYSIWPSDQFNINPIRSLLNKLGFDYSTLGLEIQAIAPAGNQLLESEKEWEKGEDCFVAVITRVAMSMNSGQGLPPVWPHTESGLSYDGNRPLLAFVEKGLGVDALFKHLDSDHLIEFDTSSSSNILSSIDFQMQKFRKECEIYRSKKSTYKLIDFTVKGLAVVGGVAILAKLGMNKDGLYVFIT